MKASDISDETILELIDSVKAKTGIWLTIWDIQQALPNFPMKVILAKLRRMVSKRHITGCPCGCYGGFERP